jgi:hypothetical protein
MAGVLSLLNRHVLRPNADWKKDRYGSASPLRRAAPETSDGCGHPLNLPRRAHFALHLISTINDEFGLNGIADGTRLKDFPAAADLMS